MAQVCSACDLSLSLFLSYVLDLDRIIKQVTVPHKEHRPPVPMLRITSRALSLLDEHSIPDLCLFTNTGFLKTLACTVQAYSDFFYLQDPHLYSKPTMDQNTLGKKVHLHWLFIILATKYIVHRIYPVPDFFKSSRGDFKAYGGVYMLYKQFYHFIYGVWASADFIQRIS